MITKESIDKAKVTTLITTSNDLLIKAQWPRLTVGEQRLVLYMLALVEKEDEDFKTYRISIRELKKILNSKNDNLYVEFDKATDGLMTKIIKWIDPAFKDKIRLQKVTWCSSAMLAEGEGFVEMSFDPKLKPFLLALKGNFTQYELRAVIRLKNHYSLRLYQFLKYRQGLSRLDHKEDVVVELDWLKEFFGVPAGSYNHFGHFKSKILVPAQKDILAKTDIKFNFQKIKKGKKVVSIRFIWAYNPNYNQLELPMFSEMPEEEPGNGELEELKETAEETLADDSVLIRLLEFGLSRKTAQKVLANNSPEGVQDTLNHIEKVYLKPTKGKPIKNLKAYVATCLGLPPGSVTKKPKIQIDREKQIEEARQREEEATREREEQERVSAICSSYKKKHKEAMETRIKEAVKEKEKEWSKVYKEYFEQAPQHILTHLENITSPGGLRKVPYTKEQAIKKDPLIKNNFFEFVKGQFLTDEEISFEHFVKENADDEEYKVIKTQILDEKAEL